MKKKLIYIFFSLQFIHISKSDDCPCGYRKESLGGEYYICRFCSAGKYSTAASNECFMCSAGKISTHTSCSCSNCKSGTYSDSKRIQCLTCPAGKISNKDRDGCNNCPAGDYSSAGQGVCRSCAAGKRSNKKTGSTECVNCPAGTYSESSWSACEECTPGTYSASAASRSCAECPDSSSSLTRATFCFSCVPGQFFASNTRTCTPCPLGTFTDEPTFSVCTTCPPGSAAPAGSTQCSACSNGTYASAARVQSCAACEAGTFSTSSQSSSCLPCPAGSTSNSSSTSCSICQPGSFSSSNSSSACASCLPGTFADLSNATSCRACPPGFLTDTPRQAQCAPCPPGSYSGSTSASSCLLCSAGTYSPYPNSTSVCTLACPAGTFSARGQSACTECVHGQTFSDSPGSPSCTPCFTCLAGFFSSSLCNVTQDSACLPCSQCPIDTYQVSACSFGSPSVLGQDRNCTPCSTCELGVTYKSGGCVNGEPLVCTPCTYCLTGTFRACTLTSNAICVEGLHCRKNYTFEKLPWISQEETCPQGQYLAGVEVSNITLQKQKSCVQCPSYLYGPNGLWCEPCKGYRFPYWDSTACMCGVNTVPDESGTCVCPQGFSFSEAGCQPCGLNTFGNASLSLRDDWYNQANLCTACPDGTYMHAYQATHCLTCERGKYRVGDLYACLPCAVGWWAQDPANESSCTECSSQCPLGSYYAPCPANSNPSLYECIPCPEAPDYSTFLNVIGGGREVNCGWTCPLDFYRTELDECLECSNNKTCPPGYNLTYCSTFTDAHCDIPCEDAAKPLQNSIWLQGCEWGCQEGYEKVYYDYVLWSSWDCAPLGSAVFN